MNSWDGDECKASIYRQARKRHFCSLHHNNGLQNVKAEAAVGHFSLLIGGKPIFNSILIGFLDHNKFRLSRGFKLDLNVNWGKINLEHEREIALKLIRFSDFLDVWKLTWGARGNLRNLWNNSRANKFIMQPKTSVTTKICLNSWS